MRRNKAQGFGDAFHDYLKQENLGGRWNEGLLWAKWHEVVGGALARETRKISVQKGTLRVYVASSSARHQFLLEAGSILHKANAALQDTQLNSLDVRE